MPSRNDPMGFTDPRGEAQKTRDLLRQAHAERTATAEPAFRSQELDNQHGSIEPSVFPTATSEPRPKRADMNSWGAKGRTAAAGYQPATQRMRIWWGDGRVPYDYFSITPQEWHSFCQQAAMPGGSPGKWINAIGNSHEFGPIE